MTKRSLAIPVIIGIVTIAVALAAHTAASEEPARTAGTEGVIAYYFHGNVRCATCKKIEAYADEAIHQGFAEMLDDGALTWRVVNIDEPENRHFIDDFQLVTRSVVLAEYDGGTIARWKNLDKVWQLVRTKDAFVDYVQGETGEFLGEN